MKNIRKAKVHDLARIAEIFIFNYRMNFYPIFKNDDYYFCELQVPKVMKEYENYIDNIWVYDDGAVKGFIQTGNGEIERLFVEPVFQGNSIGSMLLRYAVDNLGAKTLWVLEKNLRAVRFYEKHGFWVTTDKKYEDGTTEYLLRMELKT